MQAKIPFTLLLCGTVLTGAATAAYAGGTTQTIQPGTAQVAQAADSALTNQVASLLRNDTILAGFLINVDSKDGVVRLSGTVKSESDKRYAAALASTVEGVKRVKNEITLL